MDGPPTSQDGPEQGRRRWWLRGLAWWLLCLALLVVFVRECL
jgi:hypothetical protein